MLCSRQVILLLLCQVVIVKKKKTISNANFALKVTQMIFNDRIHKHSHRLLYVLDMVSIMSVSTHPFKL